MDTGSGWTGTREMCGGWRVLNSDARQIGMVGKRQCDDLDRNRPKEATTLQSL